MKVKVDMDLCESNALCVALAPHIFEMDDEDYMHIVKEDVSAEDLEVVKRAVAVCPRSALSLHED